MLEHEGEGESTGTREDISYDLNVFFTHLFLYKNYICVYIYVRARVNVNVCVGMWKYMCFIIILEKKKRNC